MSSERLGPGIWAERGIVPRRRYIDVCDDSTGHVPQQEVPDRVSPQLIERPTIPTSMDVLGDRVKPLVHRESLVGIKQRTQPRHSTRTPPDGHTPLRRALFGPAGGTDRIDLRDHNAQQVSKLAWGLLTSSWKQCLIHLSAPGGGQRVGSTGDLGNAITSKLS
ncbi:MAG: hypothetical protein JWQ81_6627 [Amycolatopsis sp.]|nr:hypothetical protein [Amycolatopsis sp.]